MTSMVIRAASIKDISSIVKLRLAALTEKEIFGFSAPEYTVTYTSMKELRKIWSKENKLKDGFEVFVAEDSMEMLGFIVLKVEGDYGYIENVVVPKEKRKKGIGRAIVVYVENVAKSNGCRLMKTDTTENSAGVPWNAYNFWLKIGYSDTGERLRTKYDFKEIPLLKKLN